MKLRRFNEKGLAEFQRMLQDIKDSGHYHKEDLATDEYSEIVDETVDLRDSLEFENRFQLGKYLTEALSDFERMALLGEEEMWTFLAYHWLESFVGDTESPTVYSIEKYVCIGQDNWDLYYRHFVLFPYYAYSLHGKYSRSFLYPRLDTVGDFTEQLASRPKIFNNRSLVKILDDLYYDGERERPNKGCADTDESRPGTIRRFITVMKQLRRNYDMGGMNKEEIQNILPSEFSGFPPEE